jgi:hypothetical protein
MTIPGTRTLVALLVFLGSAGGAKAQLVPNLGGQRVSRHSSR